MIFISQYTSKNDSIATKPPFGHIEAYYGGRKVLADAFVEYAEEEKYLGATTFEDDVSMVERYNISLALVDDGRTLPFDRIYDNQIFQVYRVK